jgi:predicted small lipoprotein YifL
MRKTYLIAFLSLVTLFGALTGCGGKKIPPVSERIAKSWTANKVDENSVTVYTRGATTNVRNYASFKLDLSSPPTVKYTEFDGTTFTGQYSVPSDTRLVLTNLNPVPTGVTNGTIEFTIDSIDDSTLKLTRTTTSQKTGNTNNVYSLTTP